MSTRREFLVAGALGSIGYAATARLAAPARAAPPHGGAPVDAQTMYGAVRGVRSAGVCQFKGVPYGASTAERNRYLPPQRPEPWRGVRECLRCGQVSPQVWAALPAGDGRTDGHRLPPGAMGEDCLNLELWTPAVRDGEPRPVLVFFHGSSGIAPAFDGAPLARGGNVVVISVNHRLATFGALQLEDLGAPAEFSCAGAAGMRDLVQALEWVRDNAENFGGDPGCVTISGQAGGGALVSGLLAAPAAKGLFHRAAVQGGSSPNVVPRERAGRQAALFLKALGLNRTRIGELRQRSWQQLIRAEQAARAAAPDLGRAPLLDGRFLTHDPFDPQAACPSHDVPLLLSTSLEETFPGFDDAGVTGHELQRLLERRYPGRGAETLALYRKFYPAKSPFLIQAQILTDATIRRAAFRQAELKALQGEGKVHLFEWDWPSPACAGRDGAVRAPDIAAACRGPGDGAFVSRVSEQLSHAWLAFARRGNPNTLCLPPWPAYEATARATLVFGTPTQLIHDHRGEIRRFWESMPLPSGTPELGSSGGDWRDG